jgi:hypothetical protein
MAADESVSHLTTDVMTDHVDALQLQRRKS